MKSPWKFLAQLTSRRRPAEPRASSVERDEDRSVEPVATTTSNEPERDVDAARVVSVPVDAEEVRAPARHEASPSNADAHALLLEGEISRRSARTPQPKRPGRAKRARTDMVAQSPAVVNKDQNAQPSSPRETFFDEVAGLDEEIRQLRLQLAQKLHLQNVQLKKMLARFDAS